MSDRIYVGIPNHPDADYTVLGLKDIDSPDFRKAMWGRPLKFIVTKGFPYMKQLLDEFEDNAGDVEDVWMWYLDKGEGPYELFAEHVTRPELESIWREINS